MMRCSRGYLCGTAFAAVVAGFTVLSSPGRATLAPVPNPCKECSCRECKEVYVKVNETKEQYTQFGNYSNMGEWVPEANATAATFRVLQNTCDGGEAKGVKDDKGNQVTILMKFYTDGTMVCARLPQIGDYIEAKDVSNLESIS
jgi:hypothetical protein